MKKLFLISVMALLFSLAIYAKGNSETSTKVSPYDGTGSSLNLDAKQQSIVCIAAFIANDNGEKLQTAFNAGLDAGLTVNEVKEIILQMSGYCGFPRSIASSRILLPLLEERQKKGIIDEEGREANPLPADKTSLELGTEIQAMLTGGLARPAVLSNAFNPALDDYLRSHIFGDIWGRDVLDYKSRQIATIAALSSMRHTQLRGNIVAGFNVGLSEKEIEGIVAVVKTKVSMEAGEYAQGVLLGIVTER